MEWEGSPRLARQRPCACPPPALDLGSWCCRSGRRRGFVRGYHHYDEEEEELAPLDHAAGSGRWRALWRRIVRGKRRIFHGGEAATAAYDPFEYARNFEEPGSTGETEPESLSRSFSARFANPSGILRRFA